MLDCAVLPIYVLPCRTVILEVTLLPSPTSAATRVDSALVRARAVADRYSLPGVVLTTPGSVAWATGGINVAIDRSASVDVVWLAVGTDRAVVITTDVEAPRLMAENDLAALGFDLVTVPWWDAQAFVSGAANAIGAAATDLGTDGHPGFGHDLSDALTTSRLSLDPGEQDRIRALGRDAAESVQGALQSWTPGEPDREVAARIAAAVERVGAVAPVLLVGGDDRLRRFRQLGKRISRGGIDRERADGRHHGDECAVERVLADVQTAEEIAIVLERRMMRYERRRKARRLAGSHERCAQHPQQRNERECAEDQQRGVQRNLRHAVARRA